MANRTSDAEWRGDLKAGHGVIKLGSGAFEGQYSYSSRFAEGVGTNPEELIAAAHAGCFSMALAAALSELGHAPSKIHTTAKVQFGPVPGGFAITRIDLVTSASVPGIDAAAFEKVATEAKENCPVSKALKAIEITLSASLE
jgi:osmotically inducible protein OsmC